MFLTTQLCTNISRAVGNFRKREIYNFLCYVTGSKRNIYFYAGEVPLGFICADMVENTGTWLIPSNQVPETTYFNAKLFVFQERVFNPIFPKFSTSRALR